jgi:hypothetical protein
MTWVIGMCEHFISAVHFADVLISFIPGRSTRCATSIRSANMVIGFSGTVQVGDG